MAGAVDDDLGEDGLAALFALEDDALDGVLLDDGLGAPGLEHDLDAGLLADHEIHLDLELVGLIVGRAHEVALAVRVDGRAAVHRAPHLVLVEALVAQLVHARADVAGRSVLVQTVEPLLLDAAHHRELAPVQRRDHQDVAARDVAAEEIVALHDDDLLTARARRGQCRRVSRAAAADDQHVAGVVDGKGVGGLHDRLRDRGLLRRRLLGRGGLRRGLLRCRSSLRGRLLRGGRGLLGLLCAHFITSVIKCGPLGPLSVLRCFYLTF